VHRADSTTAAQLPAVLAVLERIAAAVVPLVFPVHPRTRAALRSCAPQWRAPQGVRLIEPLGPLDMLRLTEAAAVVITDSGGLQKEAFMLGAPCVTLRAETEWTETLTAGANCVVGHEVSAALAAVQRALAEAPRCTATDRRPSAARSRFWRSRHVNAALEARRRRESLGGQDQRNAGDRQRQRAAAALGLGGAHARCARPRGHLVDVDLRPCQPPPALTAGHGACLRCARDDPHTLQPRLPTLDVPGAAARPRTLGPCLR